jgi:uncharacterized damage-inducible protein DinB
VSRTRRLADALHVAFDDSPWYGPSLTFVLDDIPARRIHEHPVPGAHSIAELLVHMAHWKDVVRRRLEGDAVPDANDADWPPLAATATLRELRRRLEQAHVELADCVAALDEAGLDARVAGNRISREEIVHGILQHDVYHTGQLALLVRALRAT